MQISLALRIRMPQFINNDAGSVELSNSQGKENEKVYLHYLSEQTLALAQWCSKLFHLLLHYP